MEYLVKPEVVQYEKKKMTNPMCDLIPGCNTMKELGIVLDFWTKEITFDEIILPMRDINSLTKWKMEMVWAVNNSKAHEPACMHGVTQQVVHILDTNHEKADLQSVDSTNCTHLSLQDQNKLLVAHRIWRTFWWKIGWLEHWTCHPRIKGMC